jgi:hypothetical protein
MSSQVTPTTFNHRFSKLLQVRLRHSLPLSATVALKLSHNGKVNARRNWVGLAVADGKGVRARKNGSVCFARVLCEMYTAIFARSGILTLGLRQNPQWKTACRLERSHAHPSREPLVLIALAMLVQWTPEGGANPAQFRPGGRSTIFILADVSFRTDADGRYECCSRNINAQ